MANHVSRQTAHPGVRALQALGLTLFLVTTLFLGAVLVTWVGRGPDSFQLIALVVSTAFAVLGVAAMLVDAADLWLLGRRMSPATQRIVRYTAFGATLVAVVASIFGTNSVLVVYLLPSVIVYLFVARRRRAPAGARAGRGGDWSARRAGPPARSGAATAKARQRRGGKKHR